jgi:hypothetical protein
MTEPQVGSGAFPLKQEDYQAMCAVGDICAQAIPVLEKCKDCGLPVDQEIQILKDRQKFAQAIKRNFFPDLP